MNIVKISCVRKTEQFSKLLFNSSFKYIIRDLEFRVHCITVKYFSIFTYCLQYMLDLALLKERALLNYERSKLSASFAKI